MNLATLQLPSWTADIQQHSIKVCRNVTTIVRAFAKTFGPEIVSSANGVAAYYIECGHGAGCMAMKAAGITHNPLQAAVRSAYAELTSTEARATYQQLASLTKARAMDAVVICLCGMVAIAEGIDLAQRCYRAARATYERYYPVAAPSILPSVELAIQQPDAINAIVADINVDLRYFAQMDQLDNSRLAAVATQADEAIVHATVEQLKSARAAQVLAVECDLAAQAQLAYVVDKQIEFTEGDKRSAESIKASSPSWNPPQRDMHEEVARLLALQPSALMLSSAAETQPQAEAKQATAKAPAQRKSRAKAEPTATAAQGTAKPKRRSAKAREKTKPA